MKQYGIAPTFVLWLTLTAHALAQSPELHVSIVPAKDDHGKPVINHHEHFKVYVTNRSDKPIKIWSERCRPGHETLSFQITDKAGKSWIMRKTAFNGSDDDYPLKTISIAPGATYIWHVAPLGGNGAWSWKDIMEPNTGEDIGIVPLFGTEDNAEAKKQGVWTGRIEGQAIKVRVVNPELKTPHDYLWRSCPKQALKIMRADRSWINKKDPEYSCTPLHHASRFAYIEVVEWLLANGADVDARAYNDFSPLYFASEPKVAAVILPYRPKDKESAARFFRKPLENAADEVAYGGPDAKKWREVVKLMLDAGAPYTLQVAAYLNDANRVREVLKENPRLVNVGDGPQDVLNAGFWSPLRVAARYGRTEICKILLDHKADPNDWDNGSGFPILVAAIKHPAVVKLLLDAKADVKTRISWRGGRSGVWRFLDEATALHFAAEENVLESAKLLLDAGVDVNAKETLGQTALDVASRCRAGEVAHLIASKMDTPAARDIGWKTLLKELVFTAKSDRLKQVLKEKGVAEILAREGPGFMKSAASEIRFAETKRQEQENASYVAIIETLNGYGVPIDLYAAIATDNVARAKELLKAKPALAKEKDERKRPILHQAIALDRQTIVTLLLDAGVDANALDVDGYTALHSAAFWKREGITKVLIDRRADVNARSKNGYTPLHESARLGAVEVARLLVTAGARVDATDKEGRTPLDWAGRPDDNRTMVELLTKKGGKK